MRNKCLTFSPASGGKASLDNLGFVYYNVTQSRDREQYPPPGRKREDGWCESSEGGAGRHSGARAGNGPPAPAVTGNEVRVSQTRIQVEPRTVLFALSRYSRLRAFLFALGHEKNLWSWQGGGLPPPPAQNMDR